MKIEIDTDRDSEHELRAALRLLQDILGQGRRQRRLPTDRTPTAFELAERAEEEPRETRPSTGMFSMFDAPPSTESSEPEQEEDDPDLKHYDEEVPRIEPY